MFYVYVEFEEYFQCSRISLHTLESFSFVIYLFADIFVKDITQNEQMYIDNITRC